MKGKTKLNFCVLCNVPVPVNKNTFCSEDCHRIWWNDQPIHPIIPKINSSTEGALELRRKRIQLCQLEKADPYVYGYIPDHWEMANEEWSGASEILVSGGNRAGKTLWAARKCIQVMLEKDNAQVLCCHTSNATSVTVQQPAIYNYLPVALRGTKKGKIHYLNYSRKNGFTDGSFILPNGSRCDFINYTQSENTIEGREADLVWCDELVPQSWVETLRYRLITRRGKLLVTQTPIEGVASVYKEFVSGARIEKWGEGELLAEKVGSEGWPKGKAPRVMKQQLTERKTLFFFSEDNAYNPWDEMKKKLAGAPMGQILTRAYGWATNNLGKAFSRFRAEVHTIDREKYKDKKGTLYMVIDPAGARNWFCLWMLALEDGKKVIIREWPDFAGYGEWVLPGEKADGKVGPAQMLGSGGGISEYRERFRQIEAELGYGEPIMRLIDPRSGGTAAMSEAGGTTLIELLSEPSELNGDEGMAFVAASGIPVEQRIASINSELSWDTTKDITVLNEPNLYIDKDCYNLIWCLSEHTGRDGQKGASKDPVDCLGMLIVSKLEYIAEGGMNSVSGGSY